MGRPGGRRIRANPPPYLGISLYYADGQNCSPPSPAESVVGELEGYANNCVVRNFSQILSVDPLTGGAGGDITERCDSARAALVVKYGCDPCAELELQLRRHLIVDELGGDPSDRGVLCWSGRYSGGGECAGSGGRCARLLHGALPPGHFLPVWVDGPGKAEIPRSRQEEPDVPGETKAERTRRLARNRGFRASNRLPSETPKAKKRRRAWKKKDPRRGAQRGRAKKAYRGGPKNAAQRESMSLTRRRGPENAA